MRAGAVPLTPLWHLGCTLYLCQLARMPIHWIRGKTMARGDKSKYTPKQKRKAEHIAEGYEHRGVAEKEAKRRAWATVNRESGGGKKSGSGRGKPESHLSSHKGGKRGGAASAARPASERSASARKAARTRQRRRAAGVYSR